METHATLHIIVRSRLGAIDFPLLRMGCIVGLWKAFGDNFHIILDAVRDETFLCLPENPFPQSPPRSGTAMDTTFG
jgi:hypothetical protein